MKRISFSGRTTPIKTGPISKELAWYRRNRVASAIKRARLYRKWKQEKRCVNCASRRLVKGYVKCTRCHTAARRSSLICARRKSDLVFKHYGNKCICCNETRRAFLSIDHVNGGGGKHREALRGRTTFYTWLIAKKFPKDFRVLCMNCNVGRWRNGGLCPHEEERRESKRNKKHACQRVA